LPDGEPRCRGIDGPHWARKDVNPTRG
jgi:hypothetical protein